MMKTRGETIYNKTINLYSYHEMFRSDLFIGVGVWHSFHHSEWIWSQADVVPNGEYAAGWILVL